MTIGAMFKINTAKLYVTVVTFPINDDIMYLENINQGFKRTVLGTNVGLKKQCNSEMSIWIIWLFQHLVKWISCLFFHSKMMTMILEGVILRSITCN